MKKTVIAVLISLSAAACVLTDAWCLTLRLSEAKVRVTLSPGETETGIFHLENPTENDVSLRVYAEDWLYHTTGSGEKDFFPPGTLPSSASNWITMNPSQATIPPFGRVEINYTIQVPDEKMSGTYYSIVFFESVIGEARGPDGAAVLIAGRVGSLVFVEMSGTIERRGRVSAIAIAPPMGNKPAEFDITFTNTGTTMIALTGEFIIMDSAGGVVGRGEIAPIYVQEDMTGRQKTTWTGRLAPGLYDIIFTFDLGDDVILVEEANMQIDEKNTATEETKTPAE